MTFLKEFKFTYVGRSISGFAGDAVPNRQLCHQLVTPCTPWGPPAPPSPPPLPPHEHHDVAAEVITLIGIGAVVSLGMMAGDSRLS